MSSALALANPLSAAYEQIFSTGIVGAFCLILGYAVYRLYQSKEQQKQKADEERQAVIDRLSGEINDVHRCYHDEMKELTCQIMDVLKDKAVSETKITEVLKQVVDVQDGVERTLNRFLDRFYLGNTCNELRKL